jgi:hypothetical protein
MRMDATVIAVVVLVAGAGSARAKVERARERIPAAASNLISKAALWSAARDLASLRQIMADEFVWSFGGDDGADNAVREWRSDERYLRALSKVLRLPCRTGNYNGTPAVECPGRGARSFRAWFVETNAGWKFAAFVEGD